MVATIAGEKYKKQRSMIGFVDRFVGLCPFFFFFSYCSLPVVELVGANCHILGHNTSWVLTTCYICPRCHPFMLT